MLLPADESIHEPPQIEHWQENYLFHGWDEAFGNGVYLHLQYIPAEGVVDVRAASCVDGVLTSVVRQQAGGSAFGADGFDVDIVVPFEKMRLSYDGRGRVGVDESGWLCSGVGDSPFGFDIEISTHCVPISWRPITTELFPVDPTNIFTVAEHYEVGSTWKGAVWSGGRRIEASGLMWRDHSWGLRRFRSDAGYWTPVVLDGGRRFLTALTKRHENTWYSFAAESADDQVVNVYTDYLVRQNTAHGEVFTGATSLAVRDDRVTRMDIEVARVMGAPRNWDVNGLPNWGLVDHVGHVRSGDSAGIGSFQTAPVPTASIIKASGSGAVR